MVIQLQRNGMLIGIEKAEEIIHNYYRGMAKKGKGVHAYNKAKLPEDNLFPQDQVKTVIKLANQLGGRGIPIKDENKVIVPFMHNRQDIEPALANVPANITILDNYGKIPWNELEKLFDTFRIKYVSIPRLTKILHKKRPNLIPILDNVVAGKYLEPLLAEQGIANIQGETERAVCYIEELRKDVDTNRQALIELQNYCRNEHYDISIIRILDILLWSCLGPFKDRPCKGC